MTKSATAQKRRGKPDPRLTDTRLIPSSGNIFVDLGFDEAEAHVMALRVELMTELREHLKGEGCTQVEAARLLKVNQPRVSALMRGAWKAFSVDMLLVLAARAGLHAELRLAT